MDRAIRAATAAHSAVGWIDYGVAPLLGDVAANRGDSRHAAQYACVNMTGRRHPLSNAADPSRSASSMLQRRRFTVAAAAGLPADTHWRLGSTSCQDRNWAALTAGRHWRPGSRNCQDRNQAVEPSQRRALPLSHTRPVRTPRPRRMPCENELPHDCLPPRKCPDPRSGCRSISTTLRRSRNHEFHRGRVDANSRGDEMKATSTVRDIACAGTGSSHHGAV